MTTKGIFPIRLVLDERAFRDLVAGKVVTLAEDRIKIILSDIGWARIFKAIEDALVAEETQR